MSDDVAFLRTLPRMMWIAHGRMSRSQALVQQRVMRLRRMGMVLARPEPGNGLGRGYYALLDLTQLARTTYGKQLEPVA